jgi:hypothetical protein
MIRSYLYFFLSHRHAILSRGTQRNRQKLSECWNPFHIIYSMSSLFGRIYSTTLDFFIGFQRLGSQPMSDICDQLDLLGLHWVLEPWQLPRSDISKPSSDISDLPDLSEPHRVPVLCHNLWSYISESHRIYPTQPKLSQFEFLIGHIRSRSDISDVLTPPTVINLWGL